MWPDTECGQMLRHLQCTVYIYLYIQRFIQALNHLTCRFGRSSLLKDKLCSKLSLLKLGLSVINKKYSKLNTFFFDLSHSMSFHIDKGLKLLHAYVHAFKRTHTHTHTAYKF